MECRKVREMLAAHLEGALGVEEERIVASHLSSCIECGAALNDIKKTSVLVKGLEEVEPPPWLTEKVMAHVREEAQRKRGLLEWLFYPLRVKIPIEAVATLLVVVMTAYLYKANVPRYEAARVARGTLQTLHRDNPPASPHKETHSADLKKENREAAPPRQEQGTVPPAGEEAKAMEERRAKLEAARTEASKAASVEQKALGQVAPTPAGGAAAEKRAFSSAPKDQGPQQVNPPEPKPALSRQDLAPGRPAAESAPAAASKGAPEKGGERIDFTVRVADVGAAAQEVERMLNEAGARRLTREPGTGSETIAGVINRDKVNGLAKKLRDIGATGDFDPAIDRGDTVAVRVGISGRMKADEKGVK